MVAEKAVREAEKKAKEETKEETREEAREKGRFGMMDGKVVFGPVRSEYLEDDEEEVQVQMPMMVNTGLVKLPGTDCGGKVMKPRHCHYDCTLRRGDARHLGKKPMLERLAKCLGHAM